MGVLKSDSVERFFGRWLEDHELTFGEAILLDDCVETCKAFENAGGKAVIVGNEDQAVEGLRTWIESDDLDSSSFPGSQLYFRF
jgi:hypothetical protein